MMPKQVERVVDLVDALSDCDERPDDPVYARTPHGTFHFVITDVETEEHNNETVTVLVLREVEW